MKFLYIMLALIVTIIIDSSVVKVYDLVDKSFIPAEVKLILFSVNSSLCLLLAFVILFYFQKSFKTHVFLKTFNLGNLYKIALISLFSIATLIALLIFQQFDDGYYNTSTTIFIITISYGTAAFFLIKLSALFISWNRPKLNWIVFLYAASTLCITFNLAITAVISDVRLAERPSEIRYFVGGSVDLSAGKYLLLNDIYNFSSVIAFVSIWITTALIMISYREKLLNAMGTYLILAIPLLYFLLNYFYKFIFGDLFMHYLTIDPIPVTIALTIFLSLSKPIGGLTFAIAFWKISGTVSYEKNIRTYMIISGWGILLIFAANQGGIQTLAPYPPFGLATVAVLILAAFFMLLGIYSSATLVSVNEELRKSVRTYTSQSKLLDFIGHAELGKEMEKTAKNIILQSVSLEKDNQLGLEFDVKELRKYVEFVRNEIKKGK